MNGLEIKVVFIRNCGINKSSIVCNIVVTVAVVLIWF